MEYPKYLHPLPGDRGAQPTSRAEAAYADYLALGPARSLAALVERYQTESGPRPPTKRLASLKGWSARFAWQARAAAHDAGVAEEAARIDAEARASDLARRRAQRLRVADIAHGRAIKALLRMDIDELAGKPEAVVRMLAYADALERMDSGELTGRQETEATAAGSPVSIYEAEHGYGGFSVADAR